MVSTFRAWLELGFTRTFALLATVLLVVFAILVTAPLVSAQWIPGTMSGTMHESESISGIADVSGNGSWSVTVNASGQLTGQSSIQLSGSLPSVSSGCQQSPPSLSLDESDVWTGSVQGNIATVTIKGTLNGPSAYTVTCTVNGEPSSYSVALPFPMPINSEFTFNLSRLQSGSPYATTVGGATESFTMTSGPSTSSASATETSATTTVSNTSIASSSISTQSREVATVTGVSGDVKVELPGRSGWVPIANGTQLTPGSTIRTSSSSSATLTFSDGTYVVLGPNSQFTYSPSTLWEGLVHVVDNWLLGHGILPQPIRTPTAVVAVRGTSFTVQVLADNGTLVQVFDGSVVVTDIASNATVLLNADQQVTVPNTPGGASQQDLAASLQTFNPNQVTQWWTTSASQANSTQTSGSLPPAQAIDVQAGEASPEQLPGCAAMVLQGSTHESGAEFQAQASGDAAQWVTPSSIDFGYVAAGSCTQKSYTISVPPSTPRGTYPLLWTFTCLEANASFTCSEGYFNADVIVGSTGGSGTSNENSGGLGVYGLLLVVVLVIVVVVFVVVRLAKSSGGRPRQSETAPPKAESEAASQVQPEVSMETLDKMTKLKSLLDSGAISVEEYERMKKSILDQ